MKNNYEHNQYALKEWGRDEVTGWVATVYVGGDMAVSEMVCKRLTFPKGLCVTLEPTRYIYAGGVEDGVKIGLIQYPPFPEDEEVLLEKAIKVGQEVAEANYQWSYSIITPTKNYFFSRRNK